MRSTILAIAALASTATAWSKEWKSEYGFGRDLAVRGHMPVPVSVPGEDYSYLEAVSYTGNNTFKQLIDHNDPSLGSFDQFYYWSTEFWNGTGSPVIMFTPGEINATGYNSYLTINRTTGVLAKQLGAAGKSNSFLFT